MVYNDNIRWQSSVHVLMLRAWVQFQISPQDQEENWIPLGCLHLFCITLQSSSRYKYHSAIEKSIILHVSLKIHMLQT
jgi:hypothetical protein